MVAGYPGQHWIGHDPHQQTGPDPIDRLEQLAMPVLVAVGDQDVPGFREMSAVLARRIPGAQHRVVPGAGHMTNMERPAEVNELLSQFLGQLHPHDETARGDRVLVDPGWLEAHLRDPSVRVVEVDVGRAAHDQWHVDGAVLWNVYADLKDADYELITAPAVRRLFERSGIAPDTTVVFYGYAPAMGLWLMKLYGHRDARTCASTTDHGPNGAA